MEIGPIEEEAVTGAEGDGIGSLRPTLKFSAMAVVAGAQWAVHSAARVAVFSAFFHRQTVSTFTGAGAASRCQSSVAVVFALWHFCTRVAVVSAKRAGLRWTEAITSACITTCRYVFGSCLGRRYPVTILRAHR